MGVQIREIDVQNWTPQRVIQISYFSQPICGHSCLVAGFRLDNEQSGNDRNFLQSRIIGKFSWLRR
jgi:hypothetical protein